MGDFNEYDFTETVEAADSVLLLRGLQIYQIEQGDLIAGLLALAELLGLGVKSRTLTNAQIKAYPTTPVEIVPDPEPDERYIVFGALMQFRFTGGDYGNIDTVDGDLTLATVAGDGYGPRIAGADLAGVFTNASRDWLLPPDYNRQDSANYAGEGIYLRGYSGLGNLEDGENGDTTGNTLTVTVFFLKVPA